MKYAIFDSVKDNSPKARESDWHSLKDALGKFSELPQKDGKLWSPVSYAPGMSRGNSAVLQIEALVLDFDGGHDPSDFIDAWQGLEFAVHSTYSHSAEHPKWRAVFPLAAPVEAKDWRSVYRKLALALGGGASDASCSDAARIYYLPSCPIGKKSETMYYAGSGDFLDHAKYEDPAEEEQEERRKLNGSGKPGEDFDARADWDSILVKHGWRRSDRRDYNGQTLWIRPGKDGSKEISAKTGMGEAGDRFYCWSSSDPKVPAKKLLTKFGLLAYLEHGGNFSECAKALKVEGYGAPPKQTQLTSAEGGAQSNEFPLTDLGNAERLIHLHGQDLRYCHLWGRWLVWDGTRWQVDETGGAGVFQMAHEVVRGMQLEASLINDKDKRQAMAKWSYSCESKSRLSNMVEIAKTLKGIPISPDDLDAHPMLLNCRNGTLDIKAMKLRDHSRGDLLTKSAGCDYDESALCPVWTKFLVRTLKEDEDLIRFLWKALGYSLTGLSTEHRMMFGYGPTGNNGKSTMMEALLHVFGDYGCTTPTDTLMAKAGDSGISNDIARLKGMRFVVAPETEDGKRLNEGLVKRITGGDTITARFMRQEFFDFKPEFKLWMVGNHKPVIRGTDDAIWRRITLIPFDVTIPKEERDRSLPEKLKAEASGILAWMADGLKAWREEGLEQPERVEKASKEYREESDILGAFLDERTTANSNGTIKASKLYAAYQQWCKDTGEYCVTQTRFGRAMAERGESATKNRDGWNYGGRSLIETDYSTIYRGGE